MDRLTVGRSDDNSEESRGMGFRNFRNVAQTIASWNSDIHVRENGMNFVTNLSLLLYPDDEDPNLEFLVKFSTFSFVIERHTRRCPKRNLFHVRNLKRTTGANVFFFVQLEPAGAESMRYKIDELRWPARIPRQNSMPRGSWREWNNNKSSSALN